MTSVSDQQCQPRQVLRENRITQPTIHLPKPDGDPSLFHHRDVVDEHFSEVPSSFFTGLLRPADFAERTAENDRLDGRSDAIMIGFQARLHFFEQRLIGKLHAAGEGIAEELTTELP